MESFANNCLLARRLVENGTRFFQLFDRGWDSHGDGEKHAVNLGFKRRCGETDALGYIATKKLVHIRDFHATLLNLLGFKTCGFSYPYQGIDKKLVGVKPTKVITVLLA